MITTTIGRGPAIAAATLALLLAGAAPAMARPDPGDLGSGPVPTDLIAHCGLTRLGNQLLRCDFLTGAGVRAPDFVPSWQPTTPAESGAAGPGDLP